MGAPNQQKQSKQATEMIPELPVPPEPATMTGSAVYTENDNNLPFPITPEIEMHVVCSFNQYTCINANVRSGACMENGGGHSDS